MLSRLEQPEKTRLFMLFKFLLIVTEVSFEQSEKVESAKTTTLSGISTAVRLEQLRKAP